MRNITTTHSILKITLSMLCSVLTAGFLEAKSDKMISIKLTFQEAKILNQLMQQVELATQEVEPYLAIWEPLETLTDTTQEPGKEVVLKLPEGAPQNLLLFMQRTNILGMGAQQMDKILKKVEKSLPKEEKASLKAKKEAAQEVIVYLTSLEIQLIQQMLDQIEINTAEVEPFLAIYTPLEQAKNTE